MRMRRQRLKMYSLKRKTIETDNEGGKYSSYAADGVPIKAEIWPAGGKLQAEMYGQRLNYMLNMLYAGKEVITEGDGLCVHVDAGTKPDYKVISIKIYSQHQFLELEKI